MSIKSYDYDQSVILQNIMQLNGIESFDADISYGNGKFYKSIPEPAIKIDIDPQKDDVIMASSCATTLPDALLRSVVFDPPFLTYVKAAREHDSIMAKRFGGYWRYDELEKHYKDTLREAARILCRKGLMVFKCQDIIHNHKMHCTHINVVNWAEEHGFRLKDLFVLPAKHRMPMPSKAGEVARRQRHARIHHSYFLVLELTTC